MVARYGGHDRKPLSPVDSSALFALSATVPPFEHPQRTKGVPPTGRADVLQFKVRLAAVGVLQSPTAVFTPFVSNNINRLCKAIVARRIDGPEVIECTEDIVVPPRWEREAKEDRLDDVAGAVGTKEPVDQEEFTAALLSGSHGPSVAFSVRFV
jgi:hypothetical protein